VARTGFGIGFGIGYGLGRDGADRARALRIARGSALGGSMSKSRRRLGVTHCVAIHGVDAALTLMRHRGACREAERNAAKGLTVRVVAMLTRALPVPSPFGPPASQPVLFANPGEW